MLRVTPANLAILMCLTGLSRCEAENIKEPPGTAGAPELRPALSATVNAQSPPAPNQSQETSTVPAAETAAGKIESFFQLSSTSAQAPGGDQAPVAGDSSKARSFSLHRALWHVLDNIGIPMFFGANGNDLAPGLSQGLSTAPERPQTDNQAKFGDAHALSIKKETFLQKIPQSELEGTIYESSPGTDNKYAAPR